MRESEKWKWSCSVVSHSSRPHGLQPTRLLHPWDFPGKVLEWGAIAFSDIYIWGTHIWGLRDGHNWVTNTFTFTLIVYLQRVLISSVQQSDSVTHTHTCTHIHTHIYIWGTHIWGLRGGHNWATNTFTFMLIAYLQCVLISSVQQSDSVVCVYMFFFILSFHHGLSQDTDYSSLCYTVGPCYISRILIHNGPPGPSKLCSWLAPMKELKVPLHTLHFSLLGR